MAKNNKVEYISPETCEISINYETFFCFSGNHEGIIEEEWDEHVM